MADFNSRIIRTLFGTVEHIAPSLAGRFAFELFCRTPDPARLSERERRLLAQTSDLMAGARKHRLAGESGSFVAYEFTNWGARRDAPAALVLHGWRSRSEHMRAIIEALLGRGFRVVAVDLPGHGAASGRRLNMANAVEAVQVAAQWLGPFNAAIGHSFGGAVALNAAVGSVRHVPAVPFERLVLIASPNSMPALFRRFGRHFGLGPRTQGAFEARVEAVAGNPLATYVCSRQLATVDTPTLVIHAPDDKEVAARDAEDMAAAGRHVRLAWAPGLGHRRILSDVDVAARAAEFVAMREWASPPRPEVASLELH
ncbi:alpha/beta fold hydrolase [Nitratireductor sp. ZSWI3]|uniref:alpha/beta fold hydrolase n=1 Tax=Nitratireductor sp. ZSWI3 TaxID=2966359 RepID=UPI00214F9F04|nr:lysophospholipase [Nitratireductor sp. ZSWI3]MCR4266689.1 lysophospholipase [Nitratireductor sp. ZSWI3]